MKILIDFSQIPKQKTGVGVYALNLVQKISNIDHHNNYIFVMQDDDEISHHVRHNTKVIRVSSKYFRIPLFRLFLEQIIIPIIAIYYSVDIIHSLHYSFPLFPTKAKKVVTIHDLTFFHFPEYHQYIKVIYFKMFIRLTAICANRIITVSNATRKDLIELTKVKDKNIDLIHLGGFIKNDQFSLPGIENTKLKYGINKPYFIFIGMIEPRKNLVSLIQAFKIYIQKDSTCQLVIVGKMGWKPDNLLKEIRKSNIEDRIIFTGYISNKDKLHLLKGAKLFIYPSKYEGFGLPIIEAMSLSVPTICSNRSSMPEIAGEAAFLVNPDNYLEIYNAICLLSENVNEYKKYKKRAREQAKIFTWTSTIMKTAVAYRKAIY